MMEIIKGQDNPLSKKSSFQTRRTFLQVGLAAVGVAWVGTWIQSRLFPAETSEEAKPVTIALSELPVGGVKQISYGGTPVLVLRTEESVRAFSMVCTHLGCLVEWHSTEEEFYCPCHDGRYDKFGEVTAGPPPVPLEQFPVSVEGEQVVVGEEI